MKARILLADADGTLFDFQRGETAALAETFRHFHIPVTQQHHLIYQIINQAQWVKLEKGQTTAKNLRTDRFRLFLEEIGREGNAEEMGRFFIEKLSCQTFLIDGAEEFVRRVSGKMPVWLVTNGIASVQHGRLAKSSLKKFVAGMSVSEEVGAAKPQPDVLFDALRRAGGLKCEDAVLIGDSEAADIEAARRAGIRSVLFTNGREQCRPSRANHIARTYQEALSLLES